MRAGKKIKQFEVIAVTNQDCKSIVSGYQTIIEIENMMKMSFLKAIIRKSLQRDAKGCKV